MLTMAYFHAWTLRRDDAAEHVPWAGHLRGTGETWEGALRRWFAGGVLCAETKRYIDNFLSTYRIRPQADGEAGENSDDVFSDEELQVSRAQLDTALETRVGGRQRSVRDSAGHHANSSAAIALGHQIWPLRGATSRARACQASSWTYP